MFADSQKASRDFMKRIHALHLDDIAHLLSRATGRRECRGENC